MEIQLISKFNNSNKAYPLMVAHDQEVLEYSIATQKVIHSFEINTTGLLNLLK